MDRLEIFVRVANRLIFASVSYIIKVRIKVCLDKIFRSKLLDKLEFDGESPLTMRHGLQRSNKSVSR